MSREDSLMTVSDYFQEPAEGSLKYESRWAIAKWSTHDINTMQAASCNQHPYDKSYIFNQKCQNS